MSAPTTTNRWRAPDATLVLPASAARAEWLAARRAGLGGSDASAVAGLSPYRSRYALWLDKTGRAPATPDTDALEWGRRLEPVIREWFTDTTGVPVRRAGLMRSRRWPWQQVSLDGLAGDGGICEWKTTSWRTADAEVWLDGEVPDHAELQSQHGLAVTGRSHAHAVVLIDGRRPLHKVIERDDQLIADLTEMERQFWLDHVMADVEPPVDDSPATAEAVRLRYRVTDPGRIVQAGPEADLLLAQLEDAKARAKTATAEAEYAETQLRALIGEGELLSVLGEDRATVRQNGTFAAKRFAQEHPELAAEFTRAVDALDTRALAEAHPEIYTQYRARVLRIIKRKGA